MADGATPDPLELFSPDIVKAMSSRTRFIKIMSRFYRRIAAGYSCTVEVSDHRLGEAYTHWKNDVRRMLGISDPRTKQLDHYKHAGIIAYWLRRTVPINEIGLLAPDLAAANDNRPFRSRAQRDSDQRSFHNIGSELCALHAGFVICMAYECQKVVEPPAGAITPQILGGTAAPTAALPDRFEVDFPLLMKTKNVSPHALYMMYCALFATLSWRIPEALPAH